MRCAIYTRKSSEEGLEQEFNSLQAQREVCEASADAQRDPPLVWHLGLALGHPALDFRGTADGIHHPRELGQEAVASVFLTMRPRCGETRREGLGGRSRQQVADDLLDRGRGRTMLQDFDVPHPCPFEGNP